MIQLQNIRSKTHASASKRGLLSSLGMGAVLMASASLFSSASHSAVNTTGLAVTDDTVTVGILHSLTGTMAISETGAQEAEKLAIEQINAMGGILGRQIKVIQEDGASDWPTFAEKSRKLLVRDNVAAVFGCWTSASRKAALPVFEKENGLLYYPTFYEGLEQSKNVIYTGQEATQQILDGLNWVAKEKKAKTYYLIGSDYIWPRTSMKIAREVPSRALTTIRYLRIYVSVGDAATTVAVPMIRATTTIVHFTRFCPPHCELDHAFFLNRLLYYLTAN